MFVLFIAGTYITTRPGLSAAGADVSQLRLTAVCDADIMRFGRPVAVRVVPTDPEGRPSPAVITRAALDLVGERRCVVDAGAFMPPAPPYVSLGGDPGRDPTKETAVPNARDLYDAARGFAEQLLASERRITIAESIPGGTTTALLVMRALGYGGMVSSSSAVNSVELKEHIWREASARVSISVGGMRGRALDAVRELGDPMQAAVVGCVAGLPRDAEVVLAGGTQMLAVAAILRETSPDARVAVATTPYVARDASSSFLRTADDIGVETRVAPLDLSRSRHRGLRDYELGHVKEGVGAGGAACIAARAGIPNDELVARIDEVYDEITAL